MFIKGKKDGKVYGSLENGVLYKRIIGSRHLLRKPPAIAIDAELYDAYRTKIQAIEVHDIETSTAYRLLRAEFEQYRWVLDRGYGKQYAVHISHWRKVVEPINGQLSLW